MLCSIRSRLLPGSLRGRGATWRGDRQGGSTQPRRVGCLRTHQPLLRTRDQYTTLHLIYYTHLSTNIHNIIQVINNIA